MIQKYLSITVESDVCWWTTLKNEVKKTTKNKYMVRQVHWNLWTWANVGAFCLLICLLDQNDSRVLFWTWITCGPSCFTSHHIFAMDPLVQSLYQIFWIWDCRSCVDTHCCSLLVQPWPHHSKWLFNQRNFARSFLGRVFVCSCFLCSIVGMCQLYYCCCPCRTVSVKFFFSGEKRNKVMHFCRIPQQNPPAVLQCFERLWLMPMLMFRLESVLASLKNSNKGQTPGCVWQFNFKHAAYLPTAAIHCCERVQLRIAKLDLPLLRLQTELRFYCLSLGVQKETYVTEGCWMLNFQHSWTTSEAVGNLEWLCESLSAWVLSHQSEHVNLFRTFQDRGSPFW